MVWAMAAMAAVSAIGSISQANQASAQNANQTAWNRYNAQMGYNNDMTNLLSSALLSNFNANMTIQAGRMNASAQLSMSSFNADQVRYTTIYNNQLLAEEERLMWEAADLDLHHIEEQRAKERGTIVANQSASGTTIGEGSNKDVVVEQMAQEAMDAFVVRHNADIGASKIKNAMAQNTWQGKMQIQKVMYEGQMGAAMSLANVQRSAQGIRMESSLRTLVGGYSANSALNAGMAGTNLQSAANQAQISTNLTSGLFSAASSAYGAYNSRAVGSSSDSLLNSYTPDHYGR